MVVDEFGDRVDASMRPPFWEWAFWLVVIIVIFEGCVRRGV